MGRGIEDYDKLTLETIGNGSLAEGFQIELDRVLRNIDDPNAADGKREIIMKVVFAPNAQGSAADITLSVVSKLQPDLPVETMAYLGKQGAKPMAWEHNPEQMKLPISEDVIQEAPKTSIGGIK